MSQVDLWAYERACWEEGAELVCGVDEAGRGPLAGPVCAAAVVLPRDLNLDEALPGLNDSKKLTDKKRRSSMKRFKPAPLPGTLPWPLKRRLTPSTFSRPRSWLWAGQWRGSLADPRWPWWMETGTRDWNCLQS